MNKINNKVPVLLLAGMLNGCDYDPAEEPVQRDVYKSLEDCMADWADKTMCLKAAELQEGQRKKIADNQQHGSTVIMQPYYFYGPEYVPGSRISYHNGAAIIPRSSNFVQSTPKFTPSSSFSASRSTSVTRGGFGSAGRAAGGSSGGS